jgi:hypothetical protein
VAQYRAGELSDASAALNKSIELANSGDARHWFVQAMILFNLGDKDRAHERYRQAVEWMTERKPADEELRRFRAEAAKLLGIEEPPEAASRPARDDDNGQIYHKEEVNHAFATPVRSSGSTALCPYRSRLPDLTC